MQTFDLLGPLPSGSTVLEASAGTGKTYTIAGLTTRLVAEGAATITEVMMVTFGRMATLELRDRVRERLEHTCAALRRDVEPDDAVAALLWRDEAERPACAARLADALATFDDATIATTHEFCHRMLTGLGVLADQEPLGVLIEDLQPLAREAALDVYLRRYADLERPPLRPDEAVALALDAVAKDDAELSAGTEAARTLERVSFASEVRAEVRRRRSERGLYTYDDMLTRLRDALRDPVTGDLARRRVAQRYRWVLIDEFQDTDLVQWEIVRTAFHGRHDINVVLIGDPKQAIYAFRGADVHSYLRAVSETESTATLGSNWRSDSRLVTALHGLLGDAALGDDRIVVREVEATQPDRLTAPAPWDEPVRIRMVERDENVSVKALRPVVDADLAADVARLLSSGATLELQPGRPEPVGPRHIAVLVRSNGAGRRALEALQAADIPAVFSGSRSVYADEAARDWLTLLRALSDLTPANQRRAALTSLVGWTLPDLASADETRLTSLHEWLRHWQQVHAESGMTGLTEAIMREHGVPGRLLGHRRGERLLTDLRHVAQNLQSEEARGLGLSGLTEWLESRIAQARIDGAEDRSRRLETDADAVTIMTIHRSKGLQFPLVYLPDVGDLWVKDRDDHAPFVVHEDGRRVLDVGTGSYDTRRRRWETMQEEKAGEELRMLYVALTRAQCQVTAWWARTNNLHASALQRVLFRNPDQPHPERSYPDRTPHELAALPGISFQPVDEAAEQPTAQLPAPSREDLNAPRFTRVVDQTWRRTSYTGLTAGVHDAPAPPLPLAGREDDERGPETDDELPVVPVVEPAWAVPSPMADLPGGTQLGSLVHAVMEHLDTRVAPLEDALLAQSRHWLDRLPVTGVTAEALSQALLPSLRSPLGPLADGMTLADLDPSDRLPELDFELELVGDHRRTLADVADLVERHLSADDPLVAYPEHLRAQGLGEQVLSGFLTGSIDVLMRVGAEPRHLVVDYKTNRIGPVGAPVLVGAYTHQAMAEAMIEAHYPLQALLYGVATHRYLSWRLPGYEPQTHLGGVLYLFVRGMAGADAVAPDGRPYGVFDWSPPPALVTELSELIGGRR